MRHDRCDRRWRAEVGGARWIGRHDPRRNLPCTAGPARKFLRFTPVDADSGPVGHRLGRCVTVRRAGAPKAAVVLAALIGVAAGWAPRAEAQTVRSLVIGIDEYVELADLDGAVNDARDVAAALSRSGVWDLVVLENGAATRTRIAEEWQSMVARSAPGDTLVLTYAGHGGQEPERVSGTERDGRDEVLLLGGFRSTGPGTRERIFDDELNQWFVDAGALDLRVVFVADSCHSGTLVRSIDSRAPVPSYRTATYTITDDMLELDMPEVAAALDESDLEHVSFLAAGQEHEQVPEIALPSRAGHPEPRGALSYMFARAVEGSADTDGDGVLRRDELWRFVRENVRMMTDARQTPNLLPNSRGHEPVLRLAESLPPASATGGPAIVSSAGAPAAASAPTADGVGIPDGSGLGAAANSSTGAAEGSESVAPGASLARFPPVRLTVLHADSDVFARVRRMLAGVRMVALSESPDLVWDAQRRQVVTGMGDVAAHDVGLPNLPAVVGKWEAVRAIGALSARASLRLRVYPHDGAHRQGARIEVEIGGLRHPRLTLLGLSGNGIVHYLYPLPSDPPQVATGRPFRLELEVIPPLGADHVVAVTAGSPLHALNAEIERLDGRPAAGRAAELLANAAAGTAGWWSGIQGLFTVP